MPVLDNPKHELFAMALAVGNSQAKAAAMAGYSGDRGGATRIAANDSVMARVEELKNSAAEVVEITIANSLLRTRALGICCEESGDFQGALAAEFGIQKTLIAGGPALAAPEGKGRMGEVLDVIDLNAVRAALRLKEGTND